MNKKIKYPLIAAIGAAAAAVPVKAALFKPEKVDVPPMKEEKVDLARFRKNLSDAIKFKTIAEKQAENINWEVFDAFHAFLRERYPLIHEKLELTVIARGSLVFRWRGTRPDLDPIALTAHQDVVPISEGTWDD